MASPGPHALAVDDVDVDGENQHNADDDILISGMTNVGYWCHLAYPTQSPRTYLTSSYFGTLGYEYPTALGAKVGMPDKKVVALCGDGGFMYNPQELSTAARYGINLVAVIFNNSAYGNVKQIQAASYGARHIAVDLQNPDFVDLARSFGMEACRADTPNDLEAALGRYLASDRPALIEIQAGATPSLWDLPVTPSSMGRNRP